MSKPKESAATHIVLGSRIRRLRRHLNKTIEEVALASGLSKGYISQIERGRTSMSLSALINIAFVLGVTVDYFLGSGRGKDIVVCADRQRSFGLSGSSSIFSRLTEQMDGSMIDAILIRMPAGERYLEIPTSSFEQIIYIVEGEVVLSLEGEIFVLRAGDCAHYKSRSAHGWENRSERQAIALWIGAPHLV